MRRGDTLRAAREFVLHALKKSRMKMIIAQANVHKICLLLYPSLLPQAHGTSDSDEVLVTDKHGPILNLNGVTNTRYSAEENHRSFLAVENHMYSLKARDRTRLAVSSSSCTAQACTTF